MTKAEREELRRLLRSRFKVLKSDVMARRAELEAELVEQLDRQFAAKLKQFDDLRYQVSLAIDEANRKINDLCRGFYGEEEWGAKADRACVTFSGLPNPTVQERQKLQYHGNAAIEARVRNALLELDRQENQLLMELATSALESAESRDFFNRIPTATELVPAYRLREIVQ